MARNPLFGRHYRKAILDAARLRTTPPSLAELQTRKTAMRGWCQFNTSPCRRPSPGKRACEFHLCARCQVRFVNGHDSESICKLPPGVKIIMRYHLPGLVYTGRQSRFELHKEVDRLIIQATRYQTENLLRVIAEGVHILEEYCRILAAHTKTSYETYDMYCRDCRRDLNLCPKFRCSLPPHSGPCVHTPYVAPKRRV